MIVKLIYLMLSLLFFGGCATLGTDAKKEARAKIDTMAQTTIKSLIKENPSIKNKLEKALGYAVIDWKVTKVPVVGVGTGKGVVVDKRSGKHVYINVSRFDVGGGWGVRSFKNLILTYDSDILDDAKDGDFKFEAGAEVSAGTAQLSGDSKMFNTKVESFILSDIGGSATATIRFLRAVPDDELN